MYHLVVYKKYASVRMVLPPNNKTYNKIINVIVNLTDNDSFCGNVLKLIKA